MKLAQLACATNTTKELIHPATNKPCGVFLHGYTPDSAEWEQLQSEIVKTNSQTEVVIEKKQQKIVIDNDPEAQRMLMIKTITSITGLEDYEDSAESREELLSKAKHKWMLDQWRDHTDDRKNFFGKPEVGASSGSAV